MSEDKNEIRINGEEADPNKKLFLILKHLGNKLIACCIDELDSSLPCAKEEEAFRQDLLLLSSEEEKRKMIATRQSFLSARRKILNFFHHGYCEDVSRVMGEIKHIDINLNNINDLAPPLPAERRSGNLVRSTTQVSFGNPTKAAKPLSKK